MHTANLAGQRRSEQLLADVFVSLGFVFTLTALCLQYPDCATPFYINNFTIPLQTKQLADIAPSKSVAQHGGFYFSCCERTA